MQNIRETMMLYIVIISALLSLSRAVDSETCQTRPFIDGRIRFAGGTVSAFEGPYDDVTSPIRDEVTGERVVIGAMAQMREGDALEVLAAAKSAWSRGQVFKYSFRHATLS
jgi:hypothetical protein